MIERLAQHPNRAQIITMISAMARLTGDQLLGLSLAWVNTSEASAARAVALEPDSPLILDVLAVFDDLDLLHKLMLDEPPTLTGRAEPLTPAELRLALNALRDAVAASYAEPELTPVQYAALIDPWMQVITLAP